MFLVKRWLVPLLVRPRVAHAIKYIVYAGLLLMFASYIRDDLLAFRSTLPPDAAPLDVILTFSTTIDMFGWVALVALFELETYAISEEAWTRAMERTIHVLTDTRDNLSVDAVSAATRLLTAARQIQFLGVGASGIVAKDAQHKYFRLGMPCVAHADGPTILQSATIATRHDCYVAISNSGKSPEVIDACRRIAASRASLVTISAPGSPLSAVADVALEVDTREDGNVYTPTNSRLAHLLVLDILQVSVALMLGDMARENLRLTNEVLAESKETAAA